MKIIIRKTENFQDGAFRKYGKYIVGTTRSADIVDTKEDVFRFLLYHLNVPPKIAFWNAEGVEKKMPFDIDVKLKKLLRL